MIFDKINQKRNPDTIEFIASAYRYKTPVPTVFLFIMLKFLCTLN
ncbi:protein of unknown function [Candidatus Nitrosocosmicus franklandus]|uniref:Uncharacterized protein n=1 Tax=Candidatus Nitrosocosmicus franklandianus TaxID=1798806 RepID=A0A484I953_9ARCH|nr:protein of unknown function [Candidatus Nitrosocosmicus franklandus]